MGKEIIKGWVVMFAENVIERMCATDNGIIFTPYCIFRTRQEAKDWINEKWIGGYQGSKGAIKIKRCEIIIASNQL